MRKSLIFEFFISPTWAINEEQTAPLPTQASILCGYYTFEAHTHARTHKMSPLMSRVVSIPIVHNYKIVLNRRCARFHDTKKRHVDVYVYNSFRFSTLNFLYTLWTNKKKFNKVLRTKRLKSNTLVTNTRCQRGISKQIGERKKTGRGK